MIPSNAALPPMVREHRPPHRLLSLADRRVARALWFLAILAVIVGSLLPSNSLAIRTLERLPLSDKLEHLGMYAVLVFLPAIHERRSVLLGAAAGAIVLGVGLEIAQLLTGWREYEFADMIADAIGVCMGLAAGLVVRSRLPVARSSADISARN